MELAVGYQHNDRLRASLNRLTQATYGFDFEAWYQNGFWQGDYIPYSLVEDGEVVANVSVNRMEFDLMGQTKHYIQLGTVMTAEPYRNQGLSRRLMEHILAEYQGKADGIYLFANDGVLDFYPKFGFRTGREYQYFKQVNNPKECLFLPVDMEDSDNWITVSSAIRNSVPNDALWMKNLGLDLFYLTDMMADCLWYLPGEELYAVAEIEGERLMLHQVFAPYEVNLDAVIEAFGGEIREVYLGFVPLDQTGFQWDECKEEDTTLFLLGDDLEVIEQKKLMFPTLSHA